MTCRANSMVMLAAVCVVHLPTVAMAETIPADIRALVVRYARANGIPPRLAHAVVMVESRYRPHVHNGRVYGLMQIKYRTARGLGYRGTPQGLLDPETNIKYGMKYLAGAHRRAGGDVCQTVTKYSGGWRDSRMNSGQARYCSKAKRFIASAAAYGVDAEVRRQKGQPIMLASAEAKPRKIGLDNGVSHASMFAAPAKNEDKEAESPSIPVLAYAPIQLEDPFEKALPMQPARRIELGFWSDPKPDVADALVVEPETAARLADTTVSVAAAMAAVEGLDDGEEAGDGDDPEATAATEAAPTGTAPVTGEPESAAERVALGHSVFETPSRLPLWLAEAKERLTESSRHP